MGYLAALHYQRRVRSKFPWRLVNPFRPFYEMNIAELRAKGAETEADVHEQVMEAVETHYKFDPTIRRHDSEFDSEVEFLSKFRFGRWLLRRAL